MAVVLVAGTATLNANTTFDTGGIVFNHADSQLTVNAGKTLNFANGASITASAAGHGTLILNGQIDIAADIAAFGKGIKALQLNGSSTFTERVNADNLILGANNVVATLNKGSTLGQVSVANGATGTKINLGDAHTINGNIASAVHFTANKTLTIGGASTITGPITTAINNEGTINIGAATRINSDVGANGAALSKVHFTGNHALTFGKVDGKIYAPITTANANQGTVNIDENTTSSIMI
jgi:hypothetical protein